MATPLRLYTPADLHLGQSVQPSEGQSHYISVVMRRKPGDEILLFNGRDGEWLGRLVASGRKSYCQVVSQKRLQEREPDIWLVFAPLKRQATDWVVQKATELGVSALWPVITQRTQAERVNTERLLLIATEAAEQSERLTVPTIHPPQSLASVIEIWPPDRALYVAAERRAASKAAAIAGPGGLLIGPEGGFLPQELDGLFMHPFVHPVSLGPRILRAETAAIVGLALLLLSA